MAVLQYRDFCTEDEGRLYNIIQHYLEDEAPKLHLARKEECEGIFKRCNKECEEMFNHCIEIPKKVTQSYLLYEEYFGSFVTFKTYGALYELLEDNFPPKDFFRWFKGKAWTPKPLADCVEKRSII